MSLNPDLKTINCTACGAGLDVLGGGRVTTHICAYCGTALDALDGYKALVKFDRLDRPQTPFKIGMKGEILGVEYTVIGLLEHKERHWRWVDHQVFSPTHGYAFLTLEDGHLTFSRRFRKPVAWLSKTIVNRAEKRPQVRAGREVFKYYETSASEVSFAEGEFTWAPRKGKKTHTVTAMSEAAMLSFSSTAREREIYHTVYVDQAEVARSFGLTEPLKAKGTHALQVQKSGANDGFLAKAGLACMAVCVVLGIFMFLQNGERLPTQQRFGVSQLPVTIPFEVTQTGRLARIELQGNGRNSWSFLSVELEDPEGEVLFETGRTLEYYSGRDNEGSWSEGNNWAHLAFFPPMAGKYSLTLDMEEGDLWSGAGSSSPRRMSKMDVHIRTGVSSSFWLNLLALVFGCIGGLPLLRRFLHKRARWRGSDWVEEDDD
ncbi:DUF4178 domain-containing protein [Pseudophaeobacter sp.]|uniref:DUF4178 domain-containing protein n=1 Tax=Pseudophaeobacter sp. TaxID=1971739 RepID=UPI0032991668